MKSIQILAISALALAAVSANASTTVRMTGSTAFRAQVHTAVGKLLDSGYTYGAVGAVSGANYVVFHGNRGGQELIIKTSWSGSEAGIMACGKGTAISFLPNPDGTNKVNGVTLTTAGVTTLTTSGNVLEAADLSFSDTTQSFSQYKNTSTYQLDLAGTDPVGVVPFKWVVSGSSAPFSNITAQQARAVYGGLGAALGIFTGNTSDITSGAKVFGIGRNPDSGTRLTCFGEPGIGATTLSVYQYQPRNASNVKIDKANTGVTTVNNLILWPADNVNGQAVGVGGSGYSGGGDVAYAIRSNADSFTVTDDNGTTTYNAANSNKSYIVTYLGASDADGAIGSGATELAYNGVFLGKFTDYNTATALVNGQYTMWSYEHLYYKKGLAGVAKTFGDALSNQLNTVDAPILPGNMNASRLSDGATVTY